MQQTIAHHRLLPPPPTPKLHRRNTALVGASGSTSVPATSVTSFHRTVTSISSARSTCDSPAIALSDYQCLFASQRSETAEPIALRLIEGVVPVDFPRGTYYLAGPGMLSDDDGSNVNPLDGHGYLRAFEFGGNGEVRYSARFVETEALREEREERTGRWRFTHRGPFSVLRRGKRVGNLKVMKNVANTSVLSWARRLMCLWEGGKPYEIDAGSLETVGPVDLVGNEEGDRRGATAGKSWRRTGESCRGGDRPRLPLDFAARLLKPFLKRVFNMPSKRFLAHYKIDPKRNMLLLLSCNAEDMLLPRSKFTFYEYDCNFELKHKKEFIIPDHLMIHDWAFTDNCYVIIANRIKIDVPGSLLALSGLHPMISALSVNPSHPSTPVYLLPRFSETIAEGRDWRAPIQLPHQLWSIHLCNAFEERDVHGNLRLKLQVTACSYQWFNFQNSLGYCWRTGKMIPDFMNMTEGRESLLPHLVQVSIELDAEGTCSHRSVSRPSNRWNRPADFPVINPCYRGKRNAFVYAATTSGARRFLPHFPFDSVVKLDMSGGCAKSWAAGHREFVGEPTFVPKADAGGEEDDGYLLVVEYAVSKRRCHLVILDAKRIGEADAAAAKLEVPEELTFPLGFHGCWAPAICTKARTPVVGAVHGPL